MINNRIGKPNDYKDIDNWSDDWFMLNCNEDANQIWEYVDYEKNNT